MIDELKQQNKNLRQLLDLLRDRPIMNVAPATNTPAGSGETGSDNPKLDWAVRYLQDNPDAVSTSLRSLASSVTMPDGGTISRTYWSKAKKQLQH